MWNICISYSLSYLSFGYFSLCYIVFVFNVLLFHLIMKLPSFRMKMTWVLETWKKTMMGRWQILKLLIMMIWTVSPNYRKHNVTLTLCRLFNFFSLILSSPCICFMAYHPHKCLYSILIFMLCLNPGKYQGKKKMLRKMISLCLVLS